VMPRTRHSPRKPVASAKPARRRTAGSLLSPARQGENGVMSKPHQHTDMSLKPGYRAARMSRRRVARRPCCHGLALSLPAVHAIAVAAPR
jgi:hypothetical protein